MTVDPGRTYRAGLETKQETQQLKNMSGKLHQWQQPGLFRQIKQMRQRQREAASFPLLVTKLKVAIIVESHRKLVFCQIGALRWPNEPHQRFCRPKKEQQAACGRRARISRTARLIAGLIFRFVQEQAACRSVLEVIFFPFILAVAACIAAALRWFLHSLLPLFAVGPAPTCALLFQLHLIFFSFDAIFSN